MRTLKKTPMEMIEVHFIPSDMEFGKLYYSKEYEVSNHLCPCGCGAQVPLPIKNGEWNISNIDGKLTVTPSVQHRMYCLSHYVITEGQAIILG